MSALSFQASESGDSKVCGEVEITFDKDGNFCVGENNPTSQQSQVVDVEISLFIDVVDKHTYEIFGSTFQTEVLYYFLHVEAIKIMNTLDSFHSFFK